MRSHSVLLLLLFLSGRWIVNAVAQTAEITLAEPARVRDCQPCLISPAANGPVWSFIFDTELVDGERVIRRIRASRAGTAPAILLVSEMTPVPKRGEFFFGPQDINFDGVKDLMLITDQGASNSYALYWVFNAAKSAYTLLGRYPVFTPDASRKRLVTSENHGYGGRLYERNEYAFTGPKLELVRSEKQTLLRQPDTFRRTVRERVGGRFRIVKQQTVSGNAQP